MLNSEAILGKNTKDEMNEKNQFNKLDENGFLGNYKEFVEKSIKEKIVITVKKIIKKLIK